MAHVPVMREEMLAALRPENGDTYVDATFGGGGYAQAILQAAACRVIAFDRDPEAVQRGKKLEEKFPGRLQVLQGTFSQFKDLLETCVPLNTQTAGIQGFVFDLGVSSFQLDTPERGFSFRFDGPLDMRMSPDGISAADVVNTFPEEELAGIIYRLGEEKKSRVIARHIVAARLKVPFQSTLQLADLIKSVIRGGKPGGKPGQHPATQTFQALRMFVNNELGEIEQGLEAAEEYLTPGGRLVVVAFHSLEDRLVKQFLNQRCGKTVQGSRYAPPVKDRKVLKVTFSQSRKWGTGPKGIKPASEEILKNPRSRSARLRSVVRVAHGSDGADETRFNGAGK